MHVNVFQLAIKASESISDVNTLLLVCSEQQKEKIKRKIESIFAVNIGHLNAIYKSMRERGIKGNLLSYWLSITEKEKVIVQKVYKNVKHYSSIPEEWKTEEKRLGYFYAKKFRNGVRLKKLYEKIIFTFKEIEKTLDFQKALQTMDLFRISYDKMKKREIKENKKIEEIAAEHKLIIFLRSLFTEIGSLLTEKRMDLIFENMLRNLSQEDQKIYEAKKKLEQTFENRKYDEKDFETILKTISFYDFLANASLLQKKLEMAVRRKTKKQEGMLLLQSFFFDLGNEIRKKNPKWSFLEEMIENLKERWDKKAFCSSSLIMQIPLFFQKIREDHGKNAIRKIQFKDDLGFQVSFESTVTNITENSENKPSFGHLSSEEE